jgi:hypothetical protein
MEKKKSKKVVIIAIVIVIALVCICIKALVKNSENVSDDLQSSNSYDERIDMVKGGTPYIIPDITYEEAYDNFFENPTWRYFDSTDGDEVVEFAGKCRYSSDGNGDEIDYNNATVYIQFVLEDEDGDGENEAFEMYYLKLDVDGETVKTDGTTMLVFVYQPFAVYSEEKLGKPLGDDVEEAFCEILETMGYDTFDTDSSNNMENNDTANEQEFDVLSYSCYAGTYEGLSGYTIYFSTFSSVENDEIGVAEIYYNGEFCERQSVYMCYDAGDWTDNSYDVLFVMYYDGYNNYLGFYQENGIYMLDYNGSTKNYDIMEMTEHYES